MWRIAGLALGGLRRTMLRVTLTTLGVCISSGALVSMVAFALGLQLQMEAPFKMLGLLNNIRVSIQEGDEAKQADAPVLDDAALERMERLPGVVVAYPDIHVRGLKLRYGEKSEIAFGIGVPREASIFNVEKELLVAGRFLQENQDPEAIVGLPLVRALGFDSPQSALGVTMTVEAMGLSPEEGKSFTFQRKEIPVTVVGVYDVPAILPPLAQRGVVLPVELMKKIPGTQFEAALRRLKTGSDSVSAGYARAIVRVKHPSDLAGVEKQIQSMGFHARAVLNDLKEMRLFFLLLQVLLAAVGTVALVVAALGIVNTLLMSVLERYQEIGIYKALGASDGDVAVLFLTEAGAIGLMGGIGGLILGRAVSWGLELAVNFYAQRQGVSAHLDLFAFPCWLLAATVLFAAFASVLAGLYPAMRASRVDPIRALRRE